MPGQVWRHTKEPSARVIAFLKHRRRLIHLAIRDRCPSAHAGGELPLRRLYR